MNFRYITNSQTHTPLFCLPPRLKRLQRIPLPRPNLEALPFPVSLTLAILPERYKSSSFCQRRLAVCRQEVLGDVFEMGLLSRRAQFSVVSKMAEFSGIFFKISEAVSVCRYGRGDGTFTHRFNFSLFNSSCLNSLVRASRIATFVTARRASFIRYRKGSTWSMLKL